MIQKKLIFAALAAILIGVCIACNAPQQDHQRKDLTKTKKSMTNKELKEKLTLALEDMKAKAIEMGIHGVAVASVLNNGDSADWIGEMKVVGTPLDLEGGYNLVAVAWSKCAEVIATMPTAAIQMRWIEADNDYTTQVLYRYGFQWPITARSYVRRFVDTITGFDYFKS